MTLVLPCYSSWVTGMSIISAFSVKIIDEYQNNDSKVFISVFILGNISSQINNWWLICDISYICTLGIMFSTSRPQECLKRCVILFCNNFKLVFFPFAPCVLRADWSQCGKPAQFFLCTHGWGSAYERDLLLMERGALTLLLSPRTRQGPSLPFHCYAIPLSVACLRARRS